MKRYESYKDSGVEWIGMVPSHWQTIRPWTLFSPENRSVSDCDEIVTCFRDGTVTLRKLRREDGFTNSLKEIGYQGIRKGDLVIHEMDGFEGSIGVSDSNGKSTPVYTVIQESDNHVNKYWMYILREMARSRYILSLSRSIRERTTEFRWNLWRNELFVNPPISEQHQIVNYLDTKTAQIDDLIKKKERKIELLKEYRTALINKVVTKGLNPDVEMKDSGVEWIGEIPRHWILTKIKYFLNGIVDTEHKTVPFHDDGEYYVIRTSNIRDGVLRLRDAKKTDEEGFREWTIRGIPKANDILLTREGPVGECCIIPSNLKFCMGQRVVWLKLNHKVIISQFLIYSIYSSHSRIYFETISLGSTLFHLNIGDIGDIPILYCESDEQHQIVSYLDTETQKIDKSISIEEKKVELLKEYRQSLISNVVTGKVDVRSN